MKSIGFEFPEDLAEQWDGFNDPGIEHFTGNRLQHLGREVPQNTIDAKIKAPARITFKQRKVAVKSIPSLSEFVSAIKQCAEASKFDDSEKAAKFFDSAKKMLEAKDISILQIRDSNTTGLVGPCENGKPFFAMLKATGQSRKIGTSTGSYGIGKFAPFTVSELRTVFVSTVWNDDLGRPKHYVQGKSVLMSHHDAKGRVRRGTGFWGVRRNCAPVIGLVDDLPDWLRLTDSDGNLAEPGTMLTIIGFQPGKNWQKVLAANVAENFFGAISRGDLEVDIDDRISITRDTLPEIFSDGSILEAIKDQPGEPDRFEDTSNYLNALNEGPEVIVAKHESLHLGECQLRILIGENLPRRVAVLRNGMLITEALPGLKRFGDFKEFVAVLECPTDKGIHLLRAMEPPRHDAFEPDRLPPDRRHTGRIALRELADWVRKTLGRYARDPVKEETALDELADMFGDEDEEGSAKQKDENPGGKIIIRARQVKPKSTGAPIGGSAPTVDEEEGEGEGNGKSDGFNEGETKGGFGARGPNETIGGDGTGSGGANTVSRTMGTGLPLADVRAVLLGPRKRRVAFTPQVTGTIVVELQDSGADTNYALSIASSDQGAVSRGRVDRLPVTAGSRCVLEIELEREFAGTLRVVANAI
ncbi:hypothetical protein FKO01_49200 [Mesorhizobium sp. B2-3-3]|nr:hypothetical protein FKO01_49200 [Mesorhizobium sp. B2-3-3]